MKPVKFLLLTLGILLTINTVPLKGMAQGVENTKINQSVEVLTDFKKMKDQIPHQLFEQSEGIIIIPKMINAGLLIGGKRGKGIALVRLENGTWSDPSFITITGGSVGFQAGIQSVDLILFFKHKATMLKMDEGNFTMGGDISVTAGPVGRSVTASTDFKLEAEIYSYSRSRGVFGGITLNGAVLSVDQKANDQFYTNGISNDEILGKATLKSAPLKELRTGLTTM